MYSKILKKDPQISFYFILLLLFFGGEGVNSTFFRTIFTLNVYRLWKIMLSLSLVFGLCFARDVLSLVVQR